MALPESTSEDNPGKKTVEQEDKDFDPSPEALIDEIDDERTLEEEEAMGAASGANVQEELDALKKESEMPIEELLAYYQQMREQGSDEEEEEDEDEEEEEEENSDDEEDRENDDEPDDGSKGASDTDRDDRRDRGARGTGDRSNPQNPTGGEKSSNQSPKTTNTDRSTTTGQKTQGASKRNDVHDDSTSESATDAPECDPDGGQPSDHQAQSNADQIESNLSESPRDSGLHEASDSNTDCRIRHPITEFALDEDPTCMFKTLLGYDLDDSDDMDEDYSCSDDDNCEDERDWRRVIHVGPEFQADIPESLTEYDDLPPYENDDKLVWKCNPTITQERLIEYLRQASALSKHEDVSVSSASVPKISNDSMRLYRERMQAINQYSGLLRKEHNHENNIIPDHKIMDNVHDVYMSQSRKRARIDREIQQENALDIALAASGENQARSQNNREDNSDSTSQDTRPEASLEEYFQNEEQLLYLLLQCNYNFDEAIRRRKLDPHKYYLYEPMSLWSQEECLGFEHGLRTFGKNFRLIREDQVQTRTHAEVVAFYYLWKKSERHDVYTNQYRLDRKRSLSHPGTTDYMDKFIEDNESSILNTSSPPSPTPIDGLNKPKIKEYLVDINHSSQDRMPGFLIAHSMADMPSSKPDSSNPTVGSDLPAHEVIKVDMIDNSK